jgi:hypothetical protein
MPNYMPTGEYASFVILKKDHTAVEVHFSRESDQVLTVQTTWYLDRGAVVIGNRTYGVEDKGGGVRLFIDGYHDGEARYYEKRRY